MRIVHPANFSRGKSESIKSENGFAKIGGEF
jgi:hypothetical protein